jgi:flagellar biosynthesis/type III secretory pathway chaperone
MSATALIDAGEVRSLIEVTRRLTNLMTAELVALRAMRPKDIVPILAEKAALTSQYETRFRRLKDQKSALGMLDKTLVAELKATTDTLNAITLDNRRALSAAREVNDKLLRTIANEVSRQRNPAGAYTRSGGVERIGRGARQAGPLQFDEQA